MQRNTQPVTTSRSLVPALLLLALLIAIGGCGGGGGGGGNVTLTTDNQGEDPVVVEIPVAYIKRPLPEEAADLRAPLTFNPGARMFVRERSATTADDIDVTPQIVAIVAEEEGVSTDNIAIDIKGLESSFDGNTLVFSVRAVAEPVSANLDATTWNLWTYDIDKQQAQYLIPSRIKRNEGAASGGGHDIDPHFLPDDRIVFSSTRQVTGQALQLNEGRVQLFAALDEDRRTPAAVLHLYDPRLRGEEFRQISHNLSHDLDPTVLSTGEILFSRWNNSVTNHISLYRITPAGLALSPVYGYHSHDAGTEGSAVTYSQPRELDDGRLVALAKPFRSTSLGGAIVIIDAQHYSDYNQPLAADPGAETSGHEWLTRTEVRTDGLLSPGGQFGSVYPLRDGTQRLLVTWSECRVIDEDANSTTAGAGNYLPCTLQPENDNLAPPLYGAWLYDPVKDTQRPVVLAEEGFLISEVIAAEPRDYPKLVPKPLDFDDALAAQGKGRLLIDSVYDLDGLDNSPLGIRRHAQPGTAPYASRPARFLRIVQPVPIPGRDVYEIPRYAAGVGGAFAFREILGYVPVEPDGSVTVNISAGRPFSFSVLDARGRRIGERHDYWLQLAPGEVLHCSGCHERSSTVPHGRADAQPLSSNPGARALASGLLGFPNTKLDALYATEAGQSMAEVWDFHMPKENPVAADRELGLSPQYTDEWSATGIEPDAAITNLDYDPDWTNIPADRAIIVDNLDPGQPRRIVINYIDHIQPIWERVRQPVTNSEGIPVDTCVGCHHSEGDMQVAAGQLDLTAQPSDIDADHYRSYRELLSVDNEQWISSDGAIADRQRSCSQTDAEGNVTTTIRTVLVSPPMRAGFANGSARFFNCFEAGSCGRPDSPALPANCSEDDGDVVPASRNSIDHRGLLSPAELRLLSEWLDIGGQYYNNPFDSRLAD